MRILYVADYRSPISRNWIAHFIERGDEVHVISSHPGFRCEPRLASLELVPTRLSAMLPFRVSADEGAIERRSLRSVIRDATAGSHLSGMLLAVEQWLAPIQISRQVSHVRRLVDHLQPDLVHAMRTHFEGVLAASAVKNTPLIVSIWGNDFTLSAKRTPLVGMLTRKVMGRADAIHADCFRDDHLARAWGFDTSKPSIVLPGAGGVQPALFHPGPFNGLVAALGDLPNNAQVVVNPRGFRGYVRNDTFFRSIPLILRHRPGVVFVCIALRDSPMAERWIDRLGIRGSVRLLPPLSPEEMADVFRLARVTVSPSVHDGTPNTLLEAMASGCFPVCGNIESIREWITDGVNGLLCDPTDPESLAGSILRALDDDDLRRRAAEHNFELIRARADYGKVMSQAEQFYVQVVQGIRRSR